MGTKYSSQSASGYNASPPPDDGTTVAANKITWSGIKTKLADSIKNLADAINSQLITALDVSVNSTSVNYTTQLSDHQKPILVTGTTTISLGDATSMGVGYQVTVVNIGTSVVTVTPITGTNTLNGTAGGSITLTPYTSLMFETNAAATGYVTISGKGENKQAASITSAATLNLDASIPFGNYAHVTGTTTISAITLQAGSEFRVVFDGALNITNSASLILPGGVNIITTAGDSATFRGEAAGVVRCVSFQSSMIINNFKNKLINGAFRTNSRGYVSGTALAAGVPSTGVGYGHDGWRAGAGGGTYTFTQSAGPTTVTITAGTMICAAEGQAIDQSTMIASWTGTAQARIGINGLAPSGSYFASPIFISAVVGAQVSIEFNTGTVGTVQLENGTKPTSFEWNPADHQEAACRWFLPKITQGVWEISCASSTLATAYIPYQYPARGSPTGSIIAALANYTIANYSGVVGTPISLGITSYPGMSRVSSTITAGSPTISGGQTGEFTISGSGQILLTGLEI